MILIIKTGDQPDEISYEIPGQVYTIFYQLLSTLELNLEKGFIEEFIRYDWALFLVNLWNDVFLEDLSKGGVYLPKDLNEADVLLPLQNAYIEFNGKLNGKIIHEHGCLSLESGITHLLISFEGVGHSIDKEFFDFLKSCGHRLTFLEFYKKISNFIQEPKAFLDWLISQGFMLFSSPKKKAM